MNRSNKRNAHSEELKELALGKAQARGERTLGDIANEFNLPLGTLKGWLKQASAARAHNADTPVLPTTVATSDWSAAQRLGALLQSHGLNGEALHVWCREKGVFEHQLRQWHHGFCQTGKTSSADEIGLRLAKQKIDQLERHIRRKDRALAEAAHKHGVRSFNIAIVV